MQKNLKENMIWAGLLVAGYALVTLLVEMNVLNLYYQMIFQQIGINIILAVGLNLIVGFSGQPHIPTAGLS